MARTDDDGSRPGDEQAEGRDFGERKTADRSEGKGTGQPQDASESAGGSEGVFGLGKGLMDGLVPDLVKKMFVAGIGAMAVGEEGIRRLATDMSLPKELVAFLISQVQSTKNELFRIVAREVRDFLEHTDLGGELQKALTSLTFEVTMQIRLKPRKESNGVISSVAGKMRVRSTEEEDE